MSAQIIRAMRRRALALREEAAELRAQPPQEGPDAVTPGMLDRLALEFTELAAEAQRPG